METANDDWNDGVVPPSEDSGVGPAEDGEDTLNVEPPSDSEAESTVVREVLAGHSQVFNRRLGNRVQAAKLQMAQQGYMPGGNGPGILGFDYDPELRQRVINPKEAPVVRRIFEEYDSGLSVYRIAKGLNADGIPTKRGGKWGAAVVRNILRNPSYVGIDYYGKTRTVWRSYSRPVKVAVPCAEWIEIRGFTPPLIDLDLFERVQRKMDSRMVGRRHAGSRR